MDVCLRVSSTPTCADFGNSSSGTLHVFLRANFQEFCKPDLKRGHH